MSELAVIQPAPPPLEHLPDRASLAMQRLGEWAESAHAAHGIAEILVKTSFCPDQFRNRPGEATAAILAGVEVGLNPMAALRSFDIINNVAAPRAATLRAIVQSHGHEMILDVSTEERCVMRGKRRGSTEWQTVEWNMARARKLGLAAKPNWTKQPQAMLLARATSELARLVASDAILGIGFAVQEELEDDGQAAPGRPVSRSGTRSVSRKKPPADPPATPDEPSLDDPAPEVTEGEVVDEAEPVEAPAVVLVTDPQKRKMHASFNDLGITEREERLRITRALVDRPDLTSANDLTLDEASTLLDVLDDCASRGDQAALYAAAGLLDEPPPE